MPIVNDNPGARQRALGNNANNVVSDEVEEQYVRRVASRLLRFARRQKSANWLIGAAREAAGFHRDIEFDPSKAWVEPLRPARCRHRVDEFVGVHVSTEEKYAHYSGLARCGSVWACPVCSAIIRNGRATEIQAITESALDKGWQVLFVTLTMRHKLGDALEMTLDAMVDGWRTLTMKSGWRSMKKRLALKHYIRSTEVTCGSNGWHPHNHMLLFFESPLSALQRREFEDLMKQFWVDHVTRLTGTAPTKKHGVVIEDVADSVGISRYLSKVQEKEGVELNRKIGLEIARGDLKSGRLDSFTPFQLLDADGAGASVAETWWLEYVEATRGRRAFGYSRGIADEFLVGDLRTDEEIIEDTESAPKRLDLLPKVYDQRLRDNPRLLAEVLELAEDDLLHLVRIEYGGHYVFEEKGRES